MVYMSFKFRSVDQKYFADETCVMDRKGPVCRNIKCFHDRAFQINCAGVSFRLDLEIVCIKD